jgi:hypothetical protein
VAIRSPVRLPRLPALYETYGPSAGSASGQPGQVLHDQDWRLVRIVVSDVNDGKRSLPSGIRVAGVPRWDEKLRTGGRRGRRPRFAGATSPPGERADPGDWAKNPGSPRDHAA